MSGERGDPARVEGARPPTKTPSMPAAQNGSGHSVGTNVQSGAPSGTETERDAPGIGSDKRGDDTQ